MCFDLSPFQPECVSVFEQSVARSLTCSHASSPLFVSQENLAVAGQLFSAALLIAVKTFAYSWKDLIVPSDCVLDILYVTNTDTSDVSDFQ